MNDALKEAMASAVPDQVPDPRDNLFRPATQTQQIGDQSADPATANSGPGGLELAPRQPENQTAEKLQEKQRKAEALSPLL